MSRVIVLTGGGSGGHITPLLAVADELKQHDAATRVIYIGQRGDKLGDIPAKHASIDETFTVHAGKFRRYHGEGLRQLIDVPTHLKNFRDAFYVLAGIVESYRLLKRLQPDVIFVKGGFVGVPVGLAASRLKLPYVTHDSDAIPGLANRIIARHAAKHAVALPAEVYPYPSAKTVTTGIPLRAEFQPVTEALKRQYRQEIALPLDAQLLFIIGGGLGAQRVNHAVLSVAPHLLKEFAHLHIIHVVGRNNETEVTQAYEGALTDDERLRVRVMGFVEDVYRYSGAADVVVTRAGATNLAEFALQTKACIVIPSAFLTGGHQLKNAQYLADKQAVIVLTDDELNRDPNRLAVQVSRLLQTPKERQSLAQNLHSFAHRDAAQQLVALLETTAGERKE